MLAVLKYQSRVKLSLFTCKTFY